MATSDLASVKPQLKVNWFHVTLAALVPATWQLIWILYNTYVPVYLQAGNPNFSMEEFGIVALGFGMGPALTGFILTFDNIAALFISPFVGALSDTLRTKWGRRKVFVMFGTPFIVIGFIAIPFIALQIPGSLNGQTAELTGLLIPFMIAVFLVLAAIAIIRAPGEVLLFDITPSNKRTTANGIAVLVTGFLIVVGALGGAAMYDISPYVPFIFASVVAVITAVLLWVFIKEPEIIEERMEDEKEVRNLREIITMLRNLPPDYARSLGFLVLTSALSYTGLAMFQAFISSYGITSLGMGADDVLILPAVFAIVVMVVAIPVALLSNKLGRKRMRVVGLLIYTLAMLGAWLFASEGTILIFIIIAGIGWGFDNVNVGPMFIDSAPTEKAFGTYNGIFGISFTLGLIIGPVVGGLVVETFNSNYALIFPLMTVFVGLSIFTLLPVTKGEIKSEETA